MRMLQIARLLRQPRVEVHMTGPHWFSLILVD
jgi:hypothetical protein